MDKEQILKIIQSRPEVIAEFLETYSASLQTFLEKSDKEKEIADIESYLSCVSEKQSRLDQLKRK